MSKIKIEERKIIPIVAMISAGKSKFLNVLFNIDFSGCKAGIGTKFVNILRYNPSIQKPIFYHLNIEKENGKYVFYKDSNSEVKEGEKEIIEENKKINNLLVESISYKYEDIFYMTEINQVEFIKDKNYLLNHDFCDIPGVSVYQEFSEIKNQNEEGEGEREEDDIFYSVDVKNQQNNLIEIFSILKDYIDGGIIILNVENYYFEENYIIITILRKVIKKEIKNFLIILNKIDISKNPKKDIDLCKRMFIQKFPKCKTFNLNLNTFIPLSTLQLQNELLMKTSFTHLIKFHFYNYLSKIRKERLISNELNCYSFIDFLREIIIKFSKIMNSQEIEDKLNQLNNQESISKIESDFKNIIKEISEISIYEELYLGVSENDFNKSDDEEEFNSDVDEENENKNYDISSFRASDIIKILYIFHKENKLIPPISEETENLLKYFKEKKNIQKEEEKKKKIINDIIVFFKEIMDFEIENRNFGKEAIKIIQNLTIYDDILITFLGGVKAGKTTIINGIIGKDILPNISDEYANRGIIIGYSDTDVISLKKANLVSEQILDKRYYFFEANNIICKGEKNIEVFLKNLNSHFNEVEEMPFYYIRTKIKLFDEMGLDKSLKKKIYLIVFHGFGKETYNKIMSICNSFIFVVRNSFKEKSSKKALDSIFNQCKEQNNEFNSKLIKSCKFILNNDSNQTTTQNDLKKAKEDVQNIIKGININNVNVCFFNAKHYLNYCDIFNYFSNIEELINNEYREYIENKLKTPKFFQENIPKSFCEYFYNILVNKIKLFDAKMKKSQKISPEIDYDVTSKFNEINEKEKMKDLKKYEQKIKLILSFCKENINNMKILKESNINDFKRLFHSQIKYCNDKMREQLKEKLDYIIPILDNFFKRDFTERNQSFKDIDNFINNRENKKKKIQSLMKENNGQILMIEKNYKQNILNSLKNKRDEIHNQLKYKSCNKIYEEIDKEIESNSESLAAEIKQFLYYNDYQTLNIYNSFKKYSDMLQKSKLMLELNFDFKSYISKEFGNDNKEELDKYILEEIKKTCWGNPGNFAMSKGVKDLFYSLVFDKNYLENLIEFKKNAFLEKIEYIFKVLKKSVNMYFNDLINIIDYIEEKLLKWKELCASYDNIRKLCFEIIKT